MLTAQSLHKMSWLLMKWHFFNVVDFRLLLVYDPYSCFLLARFSRTEFQHFLYKRFIIGIDLADFDLGTERLYAEVWRTV